MDIVLKTPRSINEIGGRQNNEDSVFPPKGLATSGDSYFMVCDGVGGHEKGEVASNLAIEAFHAWFREHRMKAFSPDFFLAAVGDVQSRFDDYLDLHPEARGMGTTLTLLYLCSEGAVSVHAGDSRIYHIRNGKILFQSYDHSYVNALVKMGEITEEEARTHPDRNKILQCIQGASVSKVKADITLLSDIRSGDHFFMCTDGILEQITNDILCSILKSHAGSEEKLDSISRLCNGKTRDNYSAYLIEVESVSEDGNEGYIIPVVLDEPVQEASPGAEPKAPSPDQEQGSPGGSESIPAPSSSSTPGKSAVDIKRNPSPAIHPSGSKDRNKRKGSGIKSNSSIKNWIILALTTGILILGIFVVFMLLKSPGKMESKEKKTPAAPSTVHPGKNNNPGSPVKTDPGKSQKSDAKKAGTAPSKDGTGKEKNQEDKGQEKTKTDKPAETRNGESASPGQQNAVQAGKKEAAGNKESPPAAPDVVKPGKSY